MVMINVMELSKEAFGFEMNDDDDFASVLRRYMEEQKMSVNDLAKNTIAWFCGMKPQRKTMMNWLQKLSRKKPVEREFSGSLRY